MPKPVRTTRSMSEAQMQQGVVAHARIMGWRVHMIPDALYRRGFKTRDQREAGHRGYGLDLGDPGFPDLVLVRGDLVWFRELKVGRNKLSPEQEVWRDLLLAAGADWAEWRDTEYDDVIRMLNDAAVDS